MKGIRKKNKEELCKAILIAKDNYDKRGQDDGKLDLEKKTGKNDTKPTIKINNFRLMNVAYNSTELFDERAAALTKRDLDAGVKSG